MWNFGGEDHQAYRTQLAFDKLRYRMLPYTYSLAAAVTRNGAMLMRPLVVEFRQDPEVRHDRRRVPARARPAREPGDVAGHDAPRGLPAARPVARRARDRRRLVRLLDRRLQGGRLALPGSGALRVASGVRPRRLDPADGPRAAVHGREAGRSAHALGLHGPRRPLRALRGRRRELRLRAGPFATIPLQWDEAKGALTIGARTGSFPGMLAKRQLRVVFVSKDAAVPHSAAPAAASTVVYDGKAVVIPRKRS